MLSSDPVSLLVALRMSEALYESLARGATLAEALVFARRTLAADERFADPYHWCHFRVVGYDRAVCD